MRFARCAFGCTVCEGYGQTECAACASMTLPFEVTAGNLVHVSGYSSITLFVTRTCWGTCAECDDKTSRC